MSASLADELATPLSEAEVQMAGAAPRGSNMQPGGDPDCVASLRRLLIDALMTAIPTAKRIASWTWRQRADARRWATREVMVARGYEIRSLAPPAVIAPYILRGERDRGDALAVTATAALAAMRGSS